MEKPEDILCYCLPTPKTYLNFAHCHTLLLSSKGMDLITSNHGHLTSHCRACLQICFRLRYRDHKEELIHHSVLAGGIL